MNVTHRAGLGVGQFLVAVVGQFLLAVDTGGLKLLFDQNLAPRLVARFADAFPGSEHVRNVGLAAADDRALWEYAKAGGFAILSKDADFRQLSFLYGTPPKVIWSRVGNRSTAEIEATVRAHASDFEAFDVDPGASMLVVTA